MNWARELSDWSLPHLSRQVRVSPHVWHVQEAGGGPVLLLLHGAGGSVHSWHDLIPALAETHRVIAIDLPGHGFTRSPVGRRSGLDAMAADILALLAELDATPHAIVAHSAGAAIALRIAPDLDDPAIVGINPALAPFDGIAGWLFPFLAKALAMNPFTVPFFTMGTTQGRARRLIDGTGSRIGEESLAYYTRLIGDTAHVRGALAMMAHWDLNVLLRDLPGIAAPTLFLTGSNDRAVPPATAADAAARMPDARVRMLDGLGHLAHEEDPDRVLADIRDFLARFGKDPKVSRIS